MPETRRPLTKNKTKPKTITVDWTVTWNYFKTYVMPSTAALVSSSAVFGFASSSLSGDLSFERDFAGDFDRVLSRNRLLPDRPFGDFDRLLSCKKNRLLE